MAMEGSVLGRQGQLTTNNHILSHPLRFNDAYSHII